MSYRPTDVVEVLVWGRTVGAVARDPATGLFAFEYADAWVRDGADLSPVHLPRRPGTFVFPQLARDTYHGLPAMLADALPDRFGNALVNRWMADQGVPAAAITPLDRLAYAADRSMGALVFRPPTGPDDDEPSVVALADLVRAARAQVGGSLDDVGARAALGGLIRVGTSAGGARAKAVIAFNPETAQIRSGQLDAPAGFEHWLVKLDGVTDPSREDASASGSDPFGGGGSAAFGRIEYAYHRMAAAAGVTMSRCMLLPEGPRTHFLTRRFDRAPDGARVHMQSLCAMAHLDFNMARVHSYGSYLETVRALGLDVDALGQAFRRVAFNVFAMNRDDHTKNLAFLLREGGEWELAPAFDVTYAYNPQGAWTSAHQMGVNGKFEAITVEDLRVLGDRHGVPGINATIRDVASAVAAWPQFAAEGGVDAATTAEIGRVLAEHRPSPR